MNNKQRIEALEKRVAVLESLIQGAPVPIHVNGNGDSVKAIKRLVEEHFGVRPELLWSKRRFKEVVWPRQIGMHLAYKFTGKHLAALDRAFKRSDHSVQAACTAVCNRVSTELDSFALVKELEDKTRRLLGV